MCEANINDCDGVICQNGGTCQDGVNSFSCDCLEGYAGNMCEANINDCEGVICHNGGTCQDGVNSFSCDCTDGYTGDNCETNIDDCEGFICQNGGTCQDGIDSYTCNCTCGFSGNNCETRLNNGKHNIISTIIINRSVGYIITCPLNSCFFIKKVKYGVVNQNPRRNPNIVSPDFP